MIRKAIVILGFCAGYSLALDAATIFSEQKKSAFPDTVEIRMRTTVTLPGQGPQQVEVKMLNKGPDKSVTEIQSALMNLKMVRNGAQIGMVDLKTGKTLPAQSLPSAGADMLDVDKQFGKPEEYQSPVKADSLWKLVPKDVSKPTLFYSDKQKRVVRMETTIQGIPAVSTFRYCSSNCSLPGTLSGVDIVSTMPGQMETRVQVDVLTAQRRHSLPESLFSIPR